MAKPKSEAEETYRREVAAYLKEVRELLKWSLVQLGQAAGFSDHTAVSKALSLKHSLRFPALLTLERKSGMSLPPSLKEAAIAAQEPAAVAPLPQDEIRSLADRLMEATKDLPKAERAKLLKGLLA